MDLGIRGKVALVSASSKGLGRAIAEELAAEGVDLVMCARGAEALRATADSIRRQSGVKVVDVAADVSERTGLELGQPGGGGPARPRANYRRRVRCLRSRRYPRQ